MKTPLIISLEYLQKYGEKNREQITKIFATKKLVKSFNLNPQLEPADINLVNNNWPRKMIKSKFELYKNKKNNRWKNFKENKMQRYNRLKKMQQSTIE